MANNPKHKENIKPFEFKKGVSPNPKGRPKKIPELEVLFADILNNETRGKTEVEAILRSMIARAKRGDVKAAELILNRAYGKLKETVSVSEPEKEPCTIKWGNKVIVLGGSQ